MLVDQAGWHKSMELPSLYGFIQGHNAEINKECNESDRLFREASVHFLSHLHLTMDGLCGAFYGSLRIQ